MLHMMLKQLNRFYHFCYVCCSVFFHRHVVGAGRMFQASSHWFSSAQESCRVVDDSSNYVECECYHMSVYAARGPTDNLVGYNSVLVLFICLFYGVARVLKNKYCITGPVR